MRKFHKVLVLVPLFLLTGCAQGGGGFDIVAFVRHPVIMVIIALITLYFAFKMKGGK